MEWWNKFLRHDILTPFNGGYSRADVITNGKYRYDNVYGSHLYWDTNVWTFANPSLGLMAESGASEGLEWPVSFQNWTFLETISSTTKDFIMVPIQCVSNHCAVRYYIRFSFTT